MMPHVPPRRRRATLTAIISMPRRVFVVAALAVLSATLPATHSAARVDVGSAEARTTAAIERIRALDGRYRAVIALHPQAVDAARSLDRQRRMPGLLHGEPILLKDNIESRDLPTTAGSLALADNRPGRDAALVGALRSEGAVILGKANLSEWANFRSEHSSSGWSAVGGQTRNAVDPERSPCGSSSGSAVAVALGYVRVAIGTETSGSIVCPASVNGVVGFKPTHGIVSGEGIVPLALTQDTAGPIASDVTLAARTLAVMVDPAAQNAEQLRRGLLALDTVAELDGLRIGIFANTLGFDTRRDQNLQRVLDILADAGVELLPDLRITPYEGYQRDSYEVLLWEFRHDLNRYLAALPGPVAVRSLDELVAFNRRYDDDALRRFDQSIFRDAQSLQLSQAEYGRKRLATQHAMRDEGLDGLFEAHRLDALIGVTTGVAWKIDWINGDAFFGPGMAGQAAVAGNPHITLPLGRIEALPHGISLVGERYQDHRLAAIAKLIEDAVPH